MQMANRAKLLHKTKMYKFELISIIINDDDFPPVEVVDHAN